MDCFSPGAVLGRSFKLWGRHFLPFTMLAVAIQLPTIALAAVAASAGRGDADRLVSFVEKVLGFVVTGALTSGVLRALGGEAPRLGEMVRTGLARVWRVFGVSFLSSLAILVGLVLLVVPGVLLACAVAVAVPVVVAEPGRGASDAISRSFELTKGSRLGILLVGLVVIAFVLAVAAVAYLLVAIGGDVPGLPAGLLGAAEQVIIEAGSTIVAVALAVTYHDLRLLKEGVDTAQVAAVFE